MFFGIYNKNKKRFLLLGKAGVAPVEVASVKSATLWPTFKEANQAFSRLPRKVRLGYGVVKASEETSQDAAQEAIAEVPAAEERPLEMVVRPDFRQVPTDLDTDWTAPNELPILEVSGVQPAPEQEPQPNRNSAVIALRERAERIEAEGKAIAATYDDFEKDFEEFIAMAEKLLGQARTALEGESKINPHIAKIEDCLSQVQNVIQDNENPDPADALALYGVMRALLKAKASAESLPKRPKGVSETLAVIQYVVNSH